MKDYDISYEFGSFKEIIVRGFKYAFKDKRRLLRGLLYALYLWIFFRRFLHMIQSSVKLIKVVMMKTLEKIKIKKQSLSIQRTKAFAAIGAALGSF